MANRMPGAAPPATVEGLVQALLRRMKDLEGQVADLQGGRGRQLPTDYRFAVDPAGDLVIQQVSGSTTQLGGNGELVLRGTGNPVYDGPALVEACAQAASEKKVLELRGSFVSDQTVQWVPEQGFLVIDANLADLLYTGDDVLLNLDMDPGTSGLPAVKIEGGAWNGTPDGVAAIRGLDLRRAIIRELEGGGWGSGALIRITNEGRWSERNRLIGITSGAGNRHAIYLDVYTVGVVAWWSDGTTTTVETVEPHRFLRGDRSEVAVGAPLVDGDRTITDVPTPTTLTFEAPQPATPRTLSPGGIASRGSFARTTVRDLFVQGGQKGYAHVHIADLAGTYDSVFDRISGNIAPGSHVMKTTKGAMGGTRIADIGVERSGPGTLYLFDVPDTWNGHRPYLAGMPRLSRGEPGEEAGIFLFEGMPSQGYPFAPHPLIGGVESTGFVESQLALVQRVVEDLDITDELLGEGQVVPNGAVAYDRIRRVSSIRNGGGGTGFYLRSRWDEAPTVSRSCPGLTAPSQRTASTLLVHEPGLSLPAANAGTRWALDGVIYLSGPAAAGASVCLDVAGAASEVLWTDSTDPAESTTEQIGNTPVDRDLPTTVAERAIRISGTWEQHNFAATLDFLWGQTVSDPGTCELDDRSWLTATLIVD